MSQTEAQHDSRPAACGIVTCVVNERTAHAGSDAAHSEGRREASSALTPLSETVARDPHSRLGIGAGAWCASCRAIVTSEVQMGQTGAQHDSRPAACGIVTCVVNEPTARAGSDAAHSGSRREASSALTSLLQSIRQHCIHTIHYTKLSYQLARSATHSSPTA